jgi:hypothetical protein
MEREPSFKPVNSRPTEGTNWLPIILVGGLALIVVCAAAFALFAFFWQPDVPADPDTVATPSGAVVSFSTPTSTPEGAAPPTVNPLPPTTEVPPPATVESPPIEQPTDTPVAADDPNPPPTDPPPVEDTPDSPEPEPTDTPKPPPQPSAPVDDSFAYAIQVDPSGDPAEIIAHLNNLGIKWVKFQLSWKETEPQQGIRNWGEWDRLILAYHNAGFNIMLSIVKAPDWARPANTDLSQEGPPADPNTYAMFVGELAKRYKGGVQAIEVWNEQNLAREGGGAPMPAGDYVALLSAAHQAITTADPSIVVISGAPTPAGDVPGAAIDDITYLNQMYAAGLKNVSDAIGVHPSGYNCPATADWQTVTDPSAGFRGPYDNRHHSWCFRGTMEGYRDVMNANGDSNKLLWPTEFGWAVSSTPETGYEYAADNTREEQAQWIGEAYQQAGGWGWVGPMFLWNLNYGITRPGSEQAAFSILTPEGPTPAYNTLAGIPK